MAPTDPPDQQPVPINWDDVQYLRDQVGFCRQVFGTCCAGLTEIQLVDSPLRFSPLSLADLADHLANAEWNSLGRAAARPPVTCDGLNRKAASVCKTADTVARWQESCDSGNAEIERGLASGDRELVQRAEFALVGLLAEYSRHNTQAQLLRAELDPESGFHSATPWNFDLDKE
ncbi:MAG TPA: DUF664 domain-containing protein [Pseudonocardiaceae bacterium]|nr:DUF664 domain-containing protein [Pseudonocardiaceae bacterium]